MYDIGFAFKGKNPKHILSTTNYNGDMYNYLFLLPKLKSVICRSQRHVILDNIKIGNVGIHAFNITLSDGFYNLSMLETLTLN